MVAIWLCHDLPTLVLNMSKISPDVFSCSRSHKIYIRSNKIKLRSTYKIQDRDKSANRCNGGMNKIIMMTSHFPRYWHFVRGIHRSPMDSPHRDQWRRALMSSLISAPEQTVEQAIETPVIWDAIALIMTSLLCFLFGSSMSSNYLVQYIFRFCKTR